MSATGSAYAANTAVAYSPGTNYHFRLVVNVPAHTYSVYVTPAGGTEQTLATSYLFRSEQVTATSLANLALIAEPGSHSVNNFRIVPPVSGQTSTPNWQNIPSTPRAVRSPPSSTPCPTPPTWTA